MTRGQGCTPAQGCQWSVHKICHLAPPLPTTRQGPSRTAGPVRPPPPPFAQTQLWVDGPVWEGTVWALACHHPLGPPHGLTQLAMTQLAMGPLTVPLQCTAWHPRQTRGPLCPPRPLAPCRRPLTTTTTSLSTIALGPTPLPTRHHPKQRQHCRRGVPLPLTPPLIAVAPCKLLATRTLSTTRVWLCSRDPCSRSVVFVHVDVVLHFVEFFLFISYTHTSYRGVVHGARFCQSVDACGPVVTGGVCEP